MALRPSDTTCNGLITLSSLKARSRKNTSLASSSTTRMVPFMGLSLFELNPKLASFTKLRLNTDAAAHALRGFAHDGQTDSRPFVRTAGMHSFEDNENSF